MYVNSDWENQGHTNTSLWQYAVDPIITDVPLLIVLVLNENIIIWKKHNIFWNF